MTERTSRMDSVMNAVAMWTSFYRANIHRFAKDYLGVTLKPFQQVILCKMNECDSSVMICARGLGKTFLTALFCIIRCILYPGTKITCVSNTRGQAALILKKIQDIFMPMSANLRAEISNVTLLPQKSIVEFVNTSRIVVVACNQNARGERSNILVVDEFRMCNKHTIDSVMKKLLTTPRYCGFMDLPEWRGKYKPEENKEIYLSSAWYAGSWAHKLFVGYAEQMALGRSRLCCAFPYQLSIKEGLLTRTRVESEMSDPSFDEISWTMEMEGQFWAGSEGSLYQFDEIDPCRRIRSNGKVCITNQQAVSK